MVRAHPTVPARLTPLHRTAPLTYCASNNQKPAGSLHVSTVGGEISRLAIEADMRTFFLAMIIVILPGSAALADPANRSKFDYATPSVDRLPPVKSGAGNPCAAFGPGFVKVAGSDTCVKVGGAVRVDVGGSAGSR